MLNECTKKAPTVAPADVKKNKSNKFSKDNYITLDELCDRRRFYREQLDKEPFSSKAFDYLCRQVMMFNALIAVRKWGA